MGVGCAQELDSTIPEKQMTSNRDTVEWLKSLLDAIWHVEEVPEDWKNQLVNPPHKKGSCTICDVITIHEERADGLSAMATPHTPLVESQ